jgi:hypothetical protein
MQPLCAISAIGLILSTGLCLSGQTSPGQSAPTEAKGLPPRETPGDYEFQVRAGSVTIAGEFTGHSLRIPEGPLTNADYVAVELALFGPAGAQLKISAGDFSLRLNGKKTPLEAQPYGLVLSALKDPEWVPPEPPASKSKSGVNTGGQGQEDSGPPVTPKVPFPLQRAMSLRVQKAALPEGDRTLPQAGMIFFQYRGKTENLQSVELLYDGPAGKAVLKLRR